MMILQISTFVFFFAMCGFVASGVTKRDRLMNIFGSIAMAACGGFLFSIFFYT